MSIIVIHEVTVCDGLIRYSACPPKYVVLDAQEQPVFTIDGPVCVCRCLTDVDFNVHALSLSSVIVIIIIGEVLFSRLGANSHSLLLSSPPLPSLSCSPYPHSPQTGRL